MSGLAIVAMMLLWTAVCPGDHLQAPPASAFQTASPTASPEAGSAEALRSLLNQLVTSVKVGDKARLNQLTEDLLLRDPESFFVRVFGKEEGKQMGRAYNIGAKTLVKDFLGKIETSVKRNETEFLVTPFEEVTPPQVGEGPVLELEVSRALKEHVRFYRVQVTRSGSDSKWLLDPFVYGDGDFRLVQRVTLSALSTAPPMRIRVGGQVQSGQLIIQVRPVYPGEAKARGIQGMVRLQVIIDRKGNVSEVTVREGPQELVDSAVTAVRQWRYQPTMLNSVPVEVVTTVDVVYRLAP